jgi:hypothetical protein
MVPEVSGDTPAAVKVPSAWSLSSTCRSHIGKIPRKVLMRHGECPLAFLGLS